MIEFIWNNYQSDFGCDQNCSLICKYWREWTRDCCCVKITLFASCTMHVQVRTKKMKTDLLNMWGTANSVWVSLWVKGGILMNRYINWYHRNENIKIVTFVFLLLLSIIKVHSIYWWQTLLGYTLKWANLTIKHTWNVSYVLYNSVKSSHTVIHISACKHWTIIH